MQSFGDRWDCHKAQLNGGYHDNRHLQNAWNKYGSDNFDFVILHDCTGHTLDYINNLEISEIEKYKKMDLAYNMHDGGSGGFFLGKHLSEETKRKIGEKNRINMTGKKASDETKRKMSESQKMRYMNKTDDERKAFGEFMKKFPMSDEGRKSVSRKLRNNKNGAKYTVEQVKEIRRLHEEENLGYKEISNITHIPRHAVYLIATYRRWKDI